MDYAYRWTNAGYKTGFLNQITCQHGKCVKDKTKPNAYELNQCDQFSSFVKVVNLERRVDRKKNMEKILDIPHEFIKAVDGHFLEPTQELFDLFKGNDFGDRKGFIGCALSHYNLWNQLLDDKNNEYYLIMEDDFSLCDDFKYKIEELKSDFISKECLFLGYHMFEKNRQMVKDIYDNESIKTIKVVPLDKNLYIGGTFCYSINKNGAKKMVDYIQKNGIKHGIDYVMKILDNLQSYECQPFLVFSEWYDGGKKIDSDIQYIYDGFDNKIMLMFFTNDIKLIE
jgi:GR25 family glycosyltransferase involved in LPS biosynthesis